MSFINVNWYISLAFCLVFFIGGRQLAEAVDGSPRLSGISYVGGAQRIIDTPRSGVISRSSVNTRARGMLSLVLILLALPSLLFPLAYLPLEIVSYPWYNTFRSINRIELISALIAPAAGFSTYKKPDNAYTVYRSSNTSPVLRVVKPLAFPFCVLLISVNFISPLIKPLDRETTFYDIWADGGIYLQSTGATGGPAALMSAMYSLNNFVDSELEAASGTYTDRGGTEFWYLSRYAINRGYRTKFLRLTDIVDSPVPSIIPVSWGAEHSGGPRPDTYITLLNRSEETVTIGDPVDGMLELSTLEYSLRYGDPELVLAITTPRQR